MDTTYTIPAPAENPVPPAIVVDDTAKNFLRQTARWARFLAIMGFIVAGLFILGSFSSNVFMSTVSSEYGIPGAAFVISYLIIALLYFIPSLYLLVFSSKTFRAFQANDQFTLNIALSNLKSYFKYMGILVIIVVCLNLLIIIGIVIGVSLVHV